MDRVQNLDDIESDFFAIKTKSSIIKKNRYDVYILNHITAPLEYVDLFNLFKMATVDDNIHIHINSGGGRCSTAMQLVNAMGECKATITCHASGMVASAATWLFLAGNEFIIDDDIEFMCHYYSGGVSGKGNEIEADAKFSKKYYHKLFKKIYKGFLTSEEISKLIEGKDFYFNEKQVGKRLKKKYKSLNMDLIETKVPSEKKKK